MSKLKVTNLVKLYILFLINEKPRHGYEIIKEVERKMKKKVSAGEVYPFLKILKNCGYVVSKRVGEKKIYSLTQNGKKFARKMFERFGDLIDVAIKPKLKICAHCGCEILKGGYKEKIKGKMLKFCCIYCAKAYKEQS